MKTRRNPLTFLFVEFISYALAKDFHQEVVQVVVRQPTRHHNLWAVEQLREVRGGHVVDCIVWIYQVHL